MHKFGTFLVIVYLTIGSINSALGQSAKRPNIIFIIADDVSWDDIVLRKPGCPDLVIDKLVGRASWFDNAYLTASSCSPSRTSIISGRYPHNTGAAELHTPCRKSWRLFLITERGRILYRASREIPLRGSGLTGF